MAKYYLTKGWRVSGSDLVSSEITEDLKEKGAKLLIGKHRPHCLNSKFKQVDLVIFSPAIQQDNPELKEARKLGIKCQSYPEALGELTKEYFTIAVTGTHGKSTTASMLGLLLTKAGLDPTVIVGTKLKEFGDSTRSTNSGLTLNYIEGSNCRVGKSKYLVIEADEHFASFLNYWPKIIVLTNIERDHLDYYKNLKNILKTFKKYIGHLPKNGWLVANRDDKNVQQLTKSKKQETVYYSLKQPEAKKLKKILKVPGEHNIYNALAALTTARILKIPDRISFKALSEYKGAWRRFEVTEIKYPKSITLISDYAHHPTEIKATLEAVQEKYLYPPKFCEAKLRRARQKIWCIYQPHQYQRTYYLFNDFVKVLSRAPVDKLIITDVYDVAGREEKKIKEKVNSKKMVKAINKKNVIYLRKEEILDYLKQNLKGGEVVIIMGAGDIYNLTLRLTGLNKNHY